MATLVPTCLVAACQRGRTGTLTAGLNLDLCDRHLSALRHMCQGKHRHPYAKVAARESARLTTGGLARPGRKTPGAYECFLCGSWHVGHQRNHRVSQANGPAAQAAAAVRAKLTAPQLDHLTSSWRPAPATT